MQRVEKRSLFDFQKENEQIELMFADWGSKANFSGPCSEAYLHIFFAPPMAGLYTNVSVSIFSIATTLLVQRENTSHLSPFTSQLIYSALLP